MQVDTIESQQLCVVKVVPLRNLRRLTSADTSITLCTQTGWLGSRVVSVLDSGAEGPGFKSQPRCCLVKVLSKLFTPIVFYMVHGTIGWT